MSDFWLKWFPFTILLVGLVLFIPAVALGAAGVKLPTGVYALLGSLSGALMTNGLLLVAWQIKKECR